MRSRDLCANTRRAVRNDGIEKADDINAFLQHSRSELLRFGGVADHDGNNRMYTGLDIQAALGLSAEQYQQIAGLVAFKDQVFRIASVGKSGDVTRSVEMVVRKGANVPQLISWKEL